MQHTGHELLRQQRVVQGTWGAIRRKLPFLLHFILATLLFRIDTELLAVPALIHTLLRTGVRIRAGIRRRNSAGGRDTQHERDALALAQRYDRLCCEALVPLFAQVEELKVDLGDTAVPCVVVRS